MSAATELQERALRVDGMDCASCVASVERAARKIPGVRDIRVNLARGRAVVEFDAAKTDETTVAAAITAGGYPTQPESPLQTAGAAESARLARQAQESREWLRRAAVGAILWIPAESLHQYFHLTAHHPPHWVHWTTATLAGTALAFGAGKFYSSAFKSLRAGTANMDVLIAMGFTTAFLYSLVALIGFDLAWWTTLPPLYFAESAALLALISLGHYLEARARQGAGAAIRELLELAPSVALKVPWPPRSRLAILGQPTDTQPADTQPHEVPVADLAKGDHILIRPGDRVPTDAQIVDGKSTLDESMLTGEAMPVLRSPGDTLTGGTVNGDGKLIARVTRVGAETALAQIIQLVETAQASKPPVQKLADRVAAIFVPAVLALAGLTAVGWLAWGLTHHWPPSALAAQIAKAVCSVLLIACPCALGLAIPAALMVGTGRGAKRGILIRDIDALQSAEKLRTVVLDKTGTVTTGKPAVVSTRLFSTALPDSDLLRLIASLEAPSAHPLAKAIVAHFNSQPGSGGGLLPLTDFQSQPGIGVTASINGRALAAGGRALLTQRSIPLPPDAPDGVSEVFLLEDSRLEDSRLLGAIYLKDEVRPDSANAVAALQSMGIEVVLLTGDNESAAHRAASAVGISRVFANTRPEGKAERIRELQNEHRGAVAMVGDGVNDAPALSVADLGVAIGSGSDVAKETGDIVLVSSSLQSLVEAIHLSRQTMRVIRQNLFLAFAYNVIAIPLAAFGVLSPLIAAAAMALSDVSVIGNALRLRGNLKSVSPSQPIPTRTQSP